jgi:hypothetical protein
MTQKTEEPTHLLPWILMIPFAEQIFFLILCVVLAPSVWGIFLLYRGSILLGFSVLTLWTAAFAWFAIFLNRKNLVQFWISIPLALLVICSAIYVFFAP